MPYASCLFHCIGIFYNVTNQVFSEEWVFVILQSPFILCNASILRFSSQNLTSYVIPIIASRDMKLFKRQKHFRFCLTESNSANTSTVHQWRWWRTWLWMEMQVCSKVDPTVTRMEEFKLTPWSRISCISCVFQAEATIL